MMRTVLLKNRKLEVIGNLFWILLILYGIFRALKSAWVDSHDLAPIWKAAHTWLEGRVSPYFYTQADRGFIFKYPPWTILILSPLGLFPYSSAKVIWAILNLTCIAYCFYWLTLQGLSTKRGLTFIMIFWWILLSHFYAGQTTLAIMALALWAQTKPASSFRNLSFIYAITTKVFSAVTCLGLGKRGLQLRRLFQALALLLVSDGVVWFRLYLSRPDLTWVKFHQGWMRAARSGGTEFVHESVRSQMNHGFPAGILRALQVPPEAFQWDLIVSLGLALLFSFLWHQFSRKLTEGEKWAGWIALGVIIHPLVWNHSYVMAIPLCALAMDRSLKARHRIAQVLAGAGTFFIANFITELFGHDFVTPLELLCCKSWGVCLSGVSLVFSAAASQAGSSQVPINTTSR